MHLRLARRHLSGMRDFPADLDEIDLRILHALQDDGRISNAEIARRLGMAASAIYERIRKLEERDVIRGYTTRLDPKALGYGLVAYVRIQTGDGARLSETAPALNAMPEVQEAHRVVGEDCFFVKVRVEDTDALARLLDEEIQVLPFVASTKTTIVLNTTKETTRLPLELLLPEDEAEGPQATGETRNEPTDRRPAPVTESA